MKKAYVFLATGFEEVEAIGTVDILRRGGVETTTVSITGERAVTGAHGVPVVADLIFAETDLSDADALVLPGGMPGSTNLNEFEPLKDALRKQYNENKLVAAICAAPIVLGGLNILNGRKATCYPSFEPQLTGALIQDTNVAVDDNVITGKGPGLVFDFGLALVEYLQGKEKADEVAGGMLLI